MGRSLSTGPRRFTIASVRWLLHNPFFTGKVTYKGEEYAGLHKPLIQESLYQTVQDRLKHARGRSHKICAKYRFYTLKGIARCVYCGLPLWAETTNKGNAYYREQSGTRAYDGCPAQGKVVRCDFVDEQIASLMQNIVLRPSWKKQMLSRIASESEYVSVTRERQHVQERLRRLGKAFVDNLISDNEYEMEKRVLETKLSNLVVPEVEAAFDAASLIENLSQLWAKATAEERRKILLGMLDAVYLDMRQNMSPR